MRVAVSCGHNPERPGKTAGQYSEYSEMASVAGLLVQTLSYQGVMAYLIGTGRLEEKVAAVNRLAPDLALELHLNAGGGDGCEVLFCPGSDAGKKFAQTVNKSIVQLTGERDRGVKEGWYKMDQANGPDYFLANTVCPAIIVEGYFLDHLPDREAYAGKLDYYGRLAFAVASGIINYNKGVV